MQQKSSSRQQITLMIIERESSENDPRSSPPPKKRTACKAKLETDQNPDLPNKQIHTTPPTKTRAVCRSVCSKTSSRRSNLYIKSERTLGTPNLICRYYSDYHNHVHDHDEWQTCELVAVKLSYKTAASIWPFLLLSRKNILQNQQQVACGHHRRVLAARQPPAAGLAS